MCDAMRRTFAFALSGCSASDRGISSGVAAYIARKSLLRSSSHHSTPPPTAIVGTSQRVARRSTPHGALPISVWQSMRPSPVSTRSHRATMLSKRSTSSTISMPLRSVARSRAINAKPRPPAAPAPAHVAKSRPSLRSTTAARLRSPSSRSCTAASSAPFCGA